MTKVSHLVVDGSNIATEGRSTPSLAQLESAVAELHADMPEAMVIVVVDATFADRIEEGERERFEQAHLRREYVSPPAGAIGRGDAFLLRIAERVEATVLSNDSFQEFHGEHAWLFDPGRLLGATPVPAVGWIFVPRSPVRGPRSHVAVRDAKKAQSKVDKAIAAATREAVEMPSAADEVSLSDAETPSPAPSGVRRSPQAVNEPLTFISFVASHPLGATVSGVVQAFTSHGAVVSVEEMRCYVPLSGLGNPAPRSAREVLRKDEERDFILTALDPQRRGVELALPEVAVVSGKPSDETVEAEMALAKPPRGRRGGRKPATDAVPPVDDDEAEEATQRAAAPARGRRSRTVAEALPAVVEVEAPARARGRKKAAPAATAAALTPLAPAEDAPQRRGRSSGSSSTATGRATAAVSGGASAASRRRSTADVSPAPAPAGAGGRSSRKAASPPAGAPSETKATTSPVPAPAKKARAAVAKSQPAAATPPPTSRNAASSAASKAAAKSPGAAPRQSAAKSPIGTRAAKAAGASKTAASNTAPAKAPSRAAKSAGGGKVDPPAKKQRATAATSSSPPERARKRSG